MVSGEPHWEGDIGAISWRKGTHNNANYIAGKDNSKSKILEAKSFLAYLMNIRKDRIKWKRRKIIVELIKEYMSCVLLAFSLILDFSEWDGARRLENIVT